MGTPESVIRFTGPMAAPVSRACTRTLAVIAMTAKRRPGLKLIDVDLTRADRRGVGRAIGLVRQNSQRSAAHNMFGITYAVALAPLPDCGAGEAGAANIGVRSFSILDTGDVEP